MKNNKPANMQNEEKAATLLQRIKELEKDELEFRSARNALAEEQRFLKELTDCLPGMAYTRHDNPSWTMDYISRECLALTGYSANDLTGNNKISFAQLIHSADFERARQEIQAAMEVKTGYCVHFRIKDRTGTEKWVCEQGHGVYSDDGELINLVGFISDVTGYKQAEEKLRETTKSLRKAILGTVQAVSTPMEFRDPYTAGHQRRVADLAVAIAAELGLSQWQIEGVRIAGLIHDIGKICVPVEILSKPGRLNEVEMSLIRMHSQAGFEILKSSEFPWPIAEMVLQHHERIDGTGYPRELKGEDMLIEAKIIAVADVVEAMASSRPYRPALGLDMALEEITGKRGKHFDALVADRCVDVFRKNNFRFDYSKETARKRLL
jgi:PAS domain S-box-containing protein/putative nucleotidyltransferase with HDIG domain